MKILLKPLRLFVATILLAIFGLYLYRGLKKFHEGAHGLSIKEKPQHSFDLPAISICGDVAVSGENEELFESNLHHHYWVTHASQVFRDEGHQHP
jgi:hypothetical protein